VQLTGFTDLSLRLVMRLAVLDEGETATTQALADQLNVRYSHAAKAVAALNRLGIVDARRGRSGGLRLAAAAADVSVGAIVRELEGPGEVVECEGTNPCPLRGGCRLRSALRDAQEAFFAALDAVTIADVAAPPSRALLLSLSPRPGS